MSLWFGSCDVGISRVRDQWVLEISIQYWTLVRIAISEQIALAMADEYARVQTRLHGVGDTEVPPSPASDQGAPGR